MRLLRRECQLYLWEKVESDELDFEAVGSGFDVGFDDDVTTGGTSLGEL